MPDKFGWDNNFGNNPAPTRHGRTYTLDEIDAERKRRRALPECGSCKGRGYFDSRHGYSGHTTCSWCNGTGRAARQPEGGK